MYNPGGEYLAYIKNSLVRKPRAKVVVDGNTYTGIEHLASFPKITHETEKMIGGFPAKTCNFEIYNLDGTIDLNGKEVQIYRGLYVSDTKTVWVPMGLFYADGEDVTNNSTKRTIQFKGTDRTRLFDSPFTQTYDNGVIPAETLISSVAEKICQRHGLTVDIATKANIISYRFAENVGTPESTTDRQMIAWIAELSGCIPIISRDGQSLVFTRPTYKDNGIFADKKTYKTLSAEPLYGPINAISFGHVDYDDAYVYQDDLDVEANGLHEWQINDNPLVEQTVAKTELAPKVLNIIKGMKLYPFTLTDFIDDFIFDINDGILIKKKDGTLITTYVLGMSTTSRIRSTFKANTQDSSAADRSLAGSVKADMKRIKLSVDHINNEITALAKETDEKFTQLTVTTEGLYADINDAENGLKAAMTATAEKAESAFEKATAVENAGYITTEDAKTLISQSADNITLSVERNLKIGARNILLDSACFESFTPTGEKADVKVTVFKDSSTPSGKFSNVRFNPSLDGTVGFYYAAADILKSIEKIKSDTTYTLSFWAKYNEAADAVNNFTAKVISAGNATVVYDNGRCTTPKLSPSWQRYILTFKLTGTISDFRLKFAFGGCKTTDVSAFRLSSLKLEEGNVATDWSPSSEDIDQSVKAQISMCVQKDENNKLTSAIAIEGNKISIKSDKFTLENNGAILCNDLTCTKKILDEETGTADNFSMKISDAAITHTFNAKKICTIQTTFDSYGIPYEGITAGDMCGVWLQTNNGNGYQLSLNNSETVISNSDLSNSLVLNDSGFGFVQNGGTLGIQTNSEWSYKNIASGTRMLMYSSLGLIIGSQYGLCLSGNSGIWLCGEVRLADYYSSDANGTKKALYVDTNTGIISI